MVTAMLGEHEIDLPLLDDIEAAALINVPVLRLRKLRRRGTGPSFRVVGGMASPRYAVADLLEWLRSQPLGVQMPTGQVRRGKHAIETQ
jgi:hypothetical protein